MSRLAIPEELFAFQGFFFNNYSIWTFFTYCCPADTAGRSNVARPIRQCNGPWAISRRCCHGLRPQHHFCRSMQHAMQCCAPWAACLLSSRGLSRLCPSFRQTVHSVQRATAGICLAEYRCARSAQRPCEQVEAEPRQRTHGTGHTIWYRRRVHVTLCNSAASCLGHWGGGLCEIVWGMALSFRSPVLPLPCCRIMMWSLVECRAPALAPWSGAPHSAKSLCKRHPVTSLAPLNALRQHSTGGLQE